jgi:hypothetical protein
MLPRSCRPGRATEWRRTERRRLRALRHGWLVCAVVALWLAAAATSAQAGLAPAGELPLGFWCGPPKSFVADPASAEARMTEIRTAGFNMASGPCDPRDYYDPATNQRVLMAAQAAGIKVLLTDQRVRSAVASGNTAGLDQVISDYASYPALGGYDLADEPSASVFSQIGVVVSYLRAHDPEHPAYVNVLPDYASPSLMGTSDYPTYLDQFLSTTGTSLLSYDHYPVGGFFTNLASARTAAAAHGVQFWQIVLSTRHLDYARPTPAQKRWEGMQTLAYGGRGVMFFTYWTVGAEDPVDWGKAIIDSRGAPTSQYAEMAAVNSELQTIGRVLLSATNRYTFQTGTPAPGAIGRPPGAPSAVVGRTQLTVGIFDDRDYVYTLVANRDDAKAQEATLRLGYGSSLPEELSPSGTWSTVLPTTTGGGVATVSAALSAGGAILYRTHTPVAVNDELITGGVSGNAADLPAR